MTQIFGALGDLFNFVISRPLGWLLYWCYFVTRNYGLAILLFTGVTRVILFPLAIKQQKSSAEMFRLQPKLTALQKKHAKDKAKLQEEQMKLYQEEGYNPFGGCLPLLIQMPILFGLYNVIYRPFTYILGLSNTTIKAIVQKLEDPIIKLAGSSLGKNPTVASIMKNSRSQIYIAGAMKNHLSLVKDIMPHNALTLDFGFLGLDLTKNPNWTSLYILIPIVCYITSLISSWFAMKMNQPAATGAAPGAPGANPAGMSKTMILIMPFVSAFFALSVPSGVGFYWICTNLFMILQVFIINKFYNTKKLAAQAELASEKKKALKRQNGRAPVPQEEPEETDEEKPAIPEKTQQKKVSQPNYGGKKTKKQLLEENRKRLSAARARENNNRGQ